MNVEHLLNDTSVNLIIDWVEILKESFTVELVLLDLALFTSLLLLDQVIVCNDKSA